MSFPISPVEGQIFKNFVYKTNKWSTIQDTKYSSISRLGQLTGDGIMDIPDGGITYRFPKNAVDGWADMQGGAVTLVAGNLHCVAGNGYASVLNKSDLTLVAGQFFSLKILKTGTTNGQITIWTGVDNYYYGKDMGTYWITSGIIPVGIATNGFYISCSTFCDIAELYVGTGVYSTLLYDKSGNNLNFINTSCISTKGKFSRDLSFNGFNSYLKSQDYFSQPAIFNMHCTWNNIEGLTVNQNILGQNGLYHQAILRGANSTTLIISYWNGSALMYASFLNFFTGTNHTIGCSINRTTGIITVYKDGVLFEIKTGLTMALNVTPAYLYIGKTEAGNSTFKGHLGNIYLDSNLWSVEEEYAYSLDPTLVDSQVKSVSETPNAIVVNDSTGYPTHLVGKTTYSRIGDGNLIVPFNSYSGHSAVFIIKSWNGNSGMGSSEMVHICGSALSPYFYTHVISRAGGSAPTYVWSSVGVSQNLILTVSGSLGSIVYCTKLGDY